MLTFNIQIEGGEELKAKLRALPVTVERKVSNKACRAGAHVIQPLIKANARSMVGGEMGGQLARNIVVRATPGKRRGRVSVSVLINPNANALFQSRSLTGRQTYIPSAIEYGHIIVPRGKSGLGAKTGKAALAAARKTYGMVPAIPFVRRGFESGKNAAIAVMTTTLRDGIEQEAAKAAPSRSIAAGGGA